MRRIDYLLSSAKEEHEETIDETAGQQLAKVLDVSEEEAERVMALIDGVELFKDNDTRCYIVDEFATLLPMVSEEDFGDRLKAFWETIKAFIQRVIEAFDSQHVESRAIVEAIKIQANNTKIRSRSQLGRMQSNLDPITVKTYIPSLSILYRPPKDMGMVIANLTNLTGTVKQYLKFIDEDLMRNTAALTNTLRALSPDKYTDDVFERSLLTTLKSASPRKLIDQMGHGPQSTADSIYGPQLMGNFRFHLTSNGKNETVKDVLSNKLSLTFAASTPRPVPEQIEIARFPLNQSDLALSTIITLCDELIKSLKKSKQRTDKLQELTKAMDRIVERSGGNQNTTKETEDQIELLLSIPRVVTGWNKDPYRGVIGVCQRAMNGTLMLCKHNAG